MGWKKIIAFKTSLAHFKAALDQQQRNKNRTFRKVCDDHFPMS
jgi:hypothetical protein